MATVADEYYRKKQSESMNFSHPNRVSQQGIIKGGKSSDPLNYPTYGRGVDPGPDMNSYMLKEGLGDVGHGGFKSRPRKTDISEKNLYNSEIQLVVMGDHHKNLKLNLRIELDMKGNLMII